MSTATTTSARGATVNSPFVFGMVTTSAIVTPLATAASTAATSTAATSTAATSTAATSTAATSTADTSTAATACSDDSLLSKQYKQYNAAKIEIATLCCNDMKQLYLPESIMVIHSDYEHHIGYDCGLYVDNATCEVIPVLNMMMNISNEHLTTAQWVVAHEVAKNIKCRPHIIRDIESRLLDYNTLETLAQLQKSSPEVSARAIDRYVQHGDMENLNAVPQALVSELLRHAVKSLKRKLAV